MPGWIHLVSLALSTNFMWCARVRKHVAEKNQEVKLLQWNVFEDGLADTPGNIGLKKSFDEKFSALLKVLAGKTFVGFKKVRSYKTLPPIAAIDSTKALFGYIDVMYSAMYHTFGGEARLAVDAERSKNEPDLRNSIRTLFLQTSYDEISQEWTAPAFEEEVAKATDNEAVIDIIHGFKAQAFSSQGYLTWAKDLMNGNVLKAWKRKDNIWNDKWLTDLNIFMTKFEALDTLPASEQTAVSTFVKVTRGSPGPNPMTSMIEIFVNDEGDVQHIRSMTFQSALWFLLVQMCKHAQNNPRADEAIKNFLRSKSIPEAPEKRAFEIFKVVLNALEDWYAISNIKARHAIVKDIIGTSNPDIATLVEYDQEWQKLSVPAQFAVEARGSAAIMYNRHTFDCLSEFNNVTEMVDDNAPKANCVRVLQRKADKALFLVAAVHFESGESRDARKAGLRQKQMKAILGHLKSLALAAKEDGQMGKIILGGDFNAMAEEFVYGTEKDFWTSRAVTAVTPSLERPAEDSTPVLAPDPAFAAIVSDSLHLTDESLFLHQVSSTPADGCSRAGKSGMVIDFMVVGSLDASLTIPSQPLSIAGRSEVLGSPCESVSNAVRKFGSDHLPVGGKVVM